MHKKLSQTEILYRAFNDKMRFGNVAALEAELSGIKGCYEAHDFKKVCNKVMWRLIASIRKAHKDGWDDKERKMFGVLQRASRWLKIDNKNKRMASCVFQKENIAVGDELAAFFDKMNPNEHLEPKVVSDRDVYRSVTEYFNNSEDVGGRVFQANVKKMLELYGDKKTDYSLIHFSSLYGMMQRSAKRSKASYVPMNLFDDRLPKPDTIDKGMVLSTARIYAAYINEHLHSDKVNNLMLHKFNAFLSAVVRKNSYTQEDVKRLTQVFNSDNVSSYLARRHFQEMEKHLFQVYTQKRDIEMNKLNVWMENNPKKRPISRLARSLVYADMLQQKLIDDVDIGKENFNNLYHQKRNELAQEMEALYFESGKTLSPDEVFSQVEKRRRAEARERMEPISMLLNTKHRKAHFCGITKHLMRECGLKNTPLHPVISKGRDGLF